MIWPVVFSAESFVTLTSPCSIRRETSPLLSPAGSAAPILFSSFSM